MSGPTRYAVECDTCRLYGHAVPTEAEAVQLAGLHDHLCHRGVPTADVRSVNSPLLRAIPPLHK